MLTVATWNVNSIRQRLSMLCDWLRTSSTDIVLLQELKCTNDQFPYMELEDLGYNCAVNGQKSYNGVAILSKFPIEDIITSLPGDDTDTQARYIEGVISLPDQAVRVASIYVPNGQEVGSEAFAYKMQFFERLYQHFQKLLQYRELMLFGGDYNVAPEAIDVYDPVKLAGKVGFHLDERKKFRKLLYLGLYDAFRLKNPSSQQFSWWDYRSRGWQYNRGMRIDNILISAPAADRMSECEILSHMRGEEKPSDHVPNLCTLLKKV